MSNGTLYVMGTPIGNLGDFSPRAQRILGAVSAVASEDTRTTRKLLSHFGISRPVEAFHQHSNPERRKAYLDRLRAGESLALVTESGMPVISDPGADLISDALDAGLPVRIIPGPSALASALSVSGFSGNRVVFEGFLPVKGGKRRRILEGLAGEERTVVLYEGPHRVARTLQDLAEIFPDRRVTIARELTKKFEEVWRAPLPEAAVRYQHEKPRGEFTLVVEPGRRKKKESEK